MCTGGVGALAFVHANNKLWLQLGLFGSGFGLTLDNQARAEAASDEA